MFGLSRANEFTEKFMNIIKAKVLIICDVDKVIFISVMLSSIGRKVKQYGILLLE